MAIRSDIDNELIHTSKVGDTVYEYDYFSGSQVSIMMGDILLDDIMGISFSANQSKTPVFGYANQYYTTESAGRVLVQGSFAIAFKESAYLLYPVKRYIERMTGLQWTTPRYKTGKNGEIIRGYTNSSTEYKTFADQAALNQKRKVMQANVEQMYNWSGGDSNAGLKQSSYNNRVKQLGYLDDKSFEDWADTFEDVIWTGAESFNSSSERLNSSNLEPTTHIEDEELYSHRRLDQYPPVDIWIVYGDHSSSSPNHSVKKLVDVSILGCSQEIRVSGDAIVEIYSFMAKNIV